MNAPKWTEHDDINFPVAAQQVFNAVEAARSHPEGEQKPAHDAYTRLLQRLPPDKPRGEAQTGARVWVGPVDPPEERPPGELAGGEQRAISEVAIPPTG